MAHGESSEIAVVIPSFNQGRFLRDCIGSLERQSYSQWRALVIDDASTDGASPALAEAARSARVDVRLLPKNMGVSRVRNLGWKWSRGATFTLFVDADDLLDGTYCERLVAALAADSGAGAAFGTQYAFRDDNFNGARAYWPEREPNWKAPLEQSVLPGGGVLFRAAALADAGGWRKTLSSLYEDWELGVRILSAGWRLSWVADARYYYRRHAGAALVNWDEGKAALFRARMVRYHGHLLSEPGTLRDYLRRFVVPEVAASLRYGRWWSALRLACEAGPRAWPGLALEIFSRITHRPKGRLGR